MDLFTNLNTLESYEQFKADLQKEYQEEEPGSISQDMIGAELNNLEEDIMQAQEELQIYLT